MNRYSLIFLAIPSLCFGFDDIFDDIPNFFDGYNFSAGLLQSSPLDVSNITDTNSDDITEIFLPSHFLGTIHITSQNSDSISLFGQYIAAGAGITDQDTTSNTHKLTVDSPFFIELGVRTGIMANPSSLLYAEAGVGREHTQTHINTQSISDTHFYGSLSTGIELGVLEEWGVQIAVSARYHPDAQQSNTQFTIPHSDFGSTASLRVIYHPVSTITEPDDDLAQNEVPLDEIEDSTVTTITVDTSTEPHDEEDIDLPIG